MRERGAEERRACNDLSEIFISTPETPGLCKAWKLSPQMCRRWEKWQPPVKFRQPRARIELFIYKSLLQQHQSNVFNHSDVFFFHVDIELQRVCSDENLILWFLFHLLLKSRPYCSVEDRLPVAITNKNIICLSFPELQNSVFLDLVLLSCTTVATNSFFYSSLRSSYTATLSSTRF